MRPLPQVIQIEPRWPVALAILAILVLLTLLPGRVRAFPRWVPFCVALAMVVPMAALSLAGVKDLWLRIEPMTTLAFFVIAGFGAAYNLEYLLAENSAPLTRDDCGCRRSRHQHPWCLECRRGCSPMAVNHYRC